MTHLPPDPRILVIGSSSAGKSTLAMALAGRLGIPRIELDALYWSADWQPKPKEQLVALVRAASAGERWVADGNYSVMRPLLWPRANVIIWLNYSLPVVFWRGVRRTVRRAWTGEPLWHGNRETFRRTFFSRESILLWILVTHARRRREFAGLRRDPAFAGTAWLEFRRPREAAQWLRHVAASPAGGEAADPAAPAENDGSTRTW